MIVTVPIGVLKHGDIAFEPPLPAWKSNAIAQLGSGNLNKVASTTVATSVTSMISRPSSQLGGACMCACRFLMSGAGWCICLAWRVMLIEEGSMHCGSYTTFP